MPHATRRALSGGPVDVSRFAGDLIDQLPKECARKGLTLPTFYDSFVDLKIVFALACPEHRGTSLKQMLELLHIPQQGRQHSGLDDCRNFASIIAHLIGLQAEFSPTHRAGGMQLRGHGAERRPGDWDCPACGAIAFASKGACYRCGEPRPSGATPSPAADAAAASPRDSRDSGRSRRPGDWDCPSCAALVFASKVACFRCATPRPAGTGMLPAAGGSGSGRQPTRRAGDWDCPNPNCRALVFASRQICFRCGSPPIGSWGNSPMMAMGMGMGMGMHPQMMQQQMRMGPQQAMMSPQHMMSYPQPHMMPPQQQYAMSQLMSQQMVQVQGQPSPQGRAHQPSPQQQWAQQQAYMAQQQSYLAQQ